MRAAPAAEHVHDALHELGRLSRAGGGFDDDRIVEPLAASRRRRRL